MGTEKTRAQKMEWLELTLNAWFENHTKPLSLTELSAMFCVRFKSTHRTFREMMQILERTGSISIEKDEIRR